MFGFQTFRSQGTDNWNLLLELLQEVLFTSGKFLLSLETHSLERDFHTVHGGTEFLELRLDLICVKFVDGSLQPGFVALFELGKSFPEFVVNLDALFALVESWEVLNSKLKISLLFVNLLRGFGHIGQLLLKTFDLSVVLLALLDTGCLLELFNLSLDFIQLCGEVFAFIDKFGLNLSTLLSESSHTILDGRVDALDDGKGVLNLLVDLVIHVKLRVLVHKLDPLNEAGVLGNDLSTLFLTDLFQLGFELNKLVRLFGWLSESLLDCLH